jgi:outer membrane receptor protein involved in Fe transport
VRGSVSGPVVADKLGVGLAMGYSQREGFTTNDVNGRDLDSRSAFFAKGQMLFKPTARFETRVMFTGERARDGDYALNDLDAIRARPFHASSNVDGYTHRDIIAPTIQTTYTGTTVDFATTTGFLKWKTSDFTDLDYTALPLVTRTNAEEDFQFTTEARVSSAKAAPLILSDRVTMRWQAGVFVFTQNYTQDAVNNYSPFVLSPFINFPVTQHSPQSSLDDVGIGVYGQGTWTFAKAFDVVFGLRGDVENKSADLNTFYLPAIAPPAVVNEERTFSDVSPQVAIVYRFAPRANVYGTVSRGFKAGGFNAASPAGAEAYDQEHSWNYEAGVKASGLGDRVAASVAVFRINWDDLQVERAEPASAGPVLHRERGGRQQHRVRVRSARPARRRSRSVWQRRLHACPVRRRPDGVRREPRRQDGAKRPELHGGLRRAVYASAGRRPLAGRASGSNLLRRFPLRRPEHRGSGRLHADKPARRRAREERVLRRLGAQCIRHALCAGGVSVSGAGALRIRRREWRAEDLRYSCRSDFLEGRRR